MRRPGERRSAGFSIIELMLVVAIAGVMAVFALPSLKGLITNQKVRGITTDMHATLIFARSEAIKRNAQVNVVPVDASNWASGWSVQTTGGATLRAQDATAGITASGPAANVSYRGNGRIPGASAVQFTFRATDDTKVRMRCLGVDVSGRPMIVMDNDDNTGNGCSA
jgi:type IV fimbrial biogenesis protein FimT